MTPPRFHAAPSTSPKHDSARCGAPPKAGSPKIGAAVRDKNKKVAGNEPNERCPDEFQYGGVFSRLWLALTRDDVRPQCASRKSNVAFKVGRAPRIGLSPPLPFSKKKTGTPLMRRGSPLSVPLLTTRMWTNAVHDGALTRVAHNRAVETRCPVSAAPITVTSPGTRALVPAPTRQTNMRGWRRTLAQCALCAADGTKDTISDGALWLPAEGEPPKFAPPPSKPQEQYLILSAVLIYRFS